MIHEHFMNGFLTPFHSIRNDCRGVEDCRDGHGSNKGRERLQWCVSVELVAGMMEMSA